MLLGSCQELILKAVKKDDAGREYVDFEGIVSTEHPDHVNDLTAQDGVDWDYFAKHGVFNWEHSDAPEDFVGVPLEVKRNVSYNGRKGTWVKGRLLLNQERAKQIHKAMQSMEGSGRKIGLSIQGKALLRDPLNRRVILKSIIPKVSFTFNPINPNTYVDLVKGISMPSGPSDDLLASLVARSFPEYSADQRRAVAEAVTLLLD